MDKMSGKSDTQVVKERVTLVGRGIVELDRSLAEAQRHQDTLFKRMAAQQQTLLQDLDAQLARRHAESVGQLEAIVEKLGITVSGGGSVRDETDEYDISTSGSGDGGGVVTQGGLADELAQEAKTTASLGQLDGRNYLSSPQLGESPALPVTPSGQGSVQAAPISSSKTDAQVTRPLMSAPSSSRSRLLQIIETAATEVAADDSPQNPAGQVAPVLSDATEPSTAVADARMRAEQHMKV